MLPIRAHVRVLTALLALVALAWPAKAGDDEHDERHKHPDQLREAVERGDIKPLSDVLRSVQPKLPGEIVGVEAEYKNGTWMYEFRVLSDAGRLYEVEVNAATAKIAKIEEK